MVTAPPLRKAADAAMDESHKIILPDPWEVEASMTRHLMIDQSPNGKCRFHFMDVWHALHLGVGKSYAASGLLLLTKTIEETNQDRKIAVLSSGYRDFCKRHKLDPVIKKIDKFTLGGGGSAEPNGSWNKAAVTSNMLLFMEDYCTTNMAKLAGDKQLEVLVAFLNFHGSSQDV